MTRRKLLLSLLPVFAFVALVGGAQFTSAAPKPSLTVAIAAPRRFISFHDAQSHFHVIVTNTSDKPQRLWDTNNSWGYDNLRFEVVDRNGRLGFAITKKSRVWDRNVPTSFELAPGEHFAMDVRFDRVWNRPFLKKAHQGSFRLRMRAVFENKSSDKPAVWTGKVVSQFKDYHVSYGLGKRRTATPVRYPRRERGR